MREREREEEHFYATQLSWLKAAQKLRAARDGCSFPQPSTPTRTLALSPALPLGMDANALQTAMDAAVWWAYGAQLLVALAAVYGAVFEGPVLLAVYGVYIAAPAGYALRVLSARARSTREEPAAEEPASLASSRRAHVTCSCTLALIRRGAALARAGDDGAEFLAQFVAPHRAQDLHIGLQAQAFALHQSLKKMARTHLIGIVVQRSCGPGRLDGL